MTYFLSNRINFVLCVTLLIFSAKECSSVLCYAVLLTTDPSNSFHLWQELGLNLVSRDVMLMCLLSYLAYCYSTCLSAAKSTYLFVCFRSKGKIIFMFAISIEICFIVSIWHDVSFLLSSSRYRQGMPSCFPYLLPAALVVCFTSVILQH